VDESTEVTVYLNFILPYEGDVSDQIDSLSIQLFWSRDKESWVGESMALMSGNNVYRATIPRQDGKGNWYYDYGDGPCYWYIKMRNDATEEEEHLFTQENPNSEIYFVSLGKTVEETTTPIDTPEVINPVGELVEGVDQILSSVFGEDVIRSPIFQFIIVLMAGIAVALLVAASPLNVLLVKAFGKFFTKIRRK
jgi:hypothetical protein